MTADTACLLLHGFGGSPFEMEPLVPGLTSLGCTVDLPTLPGHDSSVGEFRRTFFPDWLAYAEDRYLSLCRSHKLVIPIGFSMGGSLALLLAARHNPAGVVSLSAPVCLQPWFPFNARTLQLLFLPLLRHLRPVMSRRPPRPESRAIAPHRGYDSVNCLPQLYSLGKGLALLRKALPDIRCPALIMHDVRDSSSWPGSALAVAAKAASRDLTLIYTRMNEHITSHHMLTTHQETKEQVAAEVRNFVARISGGHGVRQYG